MARRPEAALELTGARPDFDDRLIDLNPRGGRRRRSFVPWLRCATRWRLCSPTRLQAGSSPFRGARSRRSTRPGVACGRPPNWTKRSIPIRSATPWRGGCVRKAWEVAAQLGHTFVHYRTLLPRHLHLLRKGNGVTHVSGTICQLWHGRPPDQRSGAGSRAVT
jgi:hypothetical protein